MHRLNTVPSERTNDDEQTSEHLDTQTDEQTDSNDDEAQTITLDTATDQHPPRANADTPEIVRDARTAYSDTGDAQAGDTVKRAATSEHAGDPFGSIITAGGSRREQSAGDDRRTRRQTNLDNRRFGSVDSYLHDVLAKLDYPRSLKKRAEQILSTVRESPKRVVKEYSVEITVAAAVNTAANDHQFTVDTDDLLAAVPGRDGATHEQKRARFERATAEITDIIDAPSAPLADYPHPETDAEQVINDICYGLERTIDPDFDTTEISADAIRALNILDFEDVETRFLGRPISNGVASLITVLSLASVSPTHPFHIYKHHPVTQHSTPSTIGQIITAGVNKSPHTLADVTITQIARNIASYLPDRPDTYTTLTETVTITCPTHNEFISASCRGYKKIGYSIRLLAVAEENNTHPREITRADVEESNITSSNSIIRHFGTVSAALEDTADFSQIAYSAFQDRITEEREQADSR